MLQLLHIENIAVIERADIELEGGLTVLSGETGAGKSIVIDSIGAILGRRVCRRRSASLSTSWILPVTKGIRCISSVSSPRTEKAPAAST